MSVNLSTGSSLYLRSSWAAVDSTTPADSISSQSVHQLLPPLSQLSLRGFSLWGPFGSPRLPISVDMFAARLADFQFVQKKTRGCRESKKKRVHQALAKPETRGAGRRYIRGAGTSYIVITSHSFFPSFRPVWTPTLCCLRESSPLLAALRPRNDARCPWYIRLI